MAGSPIPSRNEIIRDLIKWAAGEYGVALAESAWDKLTDPVLVETWKKAKAKHAKKAGGGLALLALAALVAHKRKRGGK